MRDSGFQEFAEFDALGEEVGLADDGLWIARVNEFGKGVQLFLRAGEGQAISLCWKSSMTYGTAGRGRF